MTARCAMWAALALALCPASVVAEPTTTFWYTGLEQPYVVPAGYSALHVRAVGGAGGVGNPGGPALPPGRGAIVEGNIGVAPGQGLYVVVGNSGGLPEGGFNGGGKGASRQGLAIWGGGGASDVRTLPISEGKASLESRLIVAAGGGGSGYTASAGGDAGAPGGCCAIGAGAQLAQPGTATHGGAGGTCGGAAEGCGGPGGFGTGGEGGGSGALEDMSYGIGAGGGGGWYGGGGGSGRVGTSTFGGGAGGSSKSPRGGSVTLADRSMPPRVSITPYLAPRTGCSDGTDNDADGLVDYPADPGCAGRVDEDESNPDTFAPDAGLSGPRTQRLGRSVTVEVRCRATAEVCIVAATGKLTPGRATRRLKPVGGVVVPRASRAKLRLAVPGATRAAAARALRGRIRVNVEVNVQVADETGNVRRLIRRIRLVR